MTTIKIFVSNLESATTDDILSIASYLTDIESYHIHKEYDKELETIKELYERYYISFRLEYTVYEYDMSKTVSLEFRDNYSLFSATAKVVYSNNNQIIIDFDELDDFWYELTEYDFDLNLF